MPDPVTPRLYVLLDASPGRLPSSGDVLSVREASPAEVLAHPASAERIAALEADVRFWTRRSEEMTRSGNGLYSAIVERLNPHFPKDTRALEWDVLPGTVGGLAAKLDRLQAVLAAERGELGPEGWEWIDGVWSRADGDFGAMAVGRDGCPTTGNDTTVTWLPTTWTTHRQDWDDPEGPTPPWVVVAVHDYALEAMEAADRAADPFTDAARGRDASGPAEGMPDVAPDAGGEG